MDGERQTGVGAVDYRVHGAGKSTNGLFGREIKGLALRATSGLSRGPSDGECALASAGWLRRKLLPVLDRAILAEPLAEASRVDSIAESTSLLRRSLQSIPPSGMVRTGR